ALEQPVAEAEPAVEEAEFSVVEETPAVEEAPVVEVGEEPAAAADIDLSEWEDSVTVEGEEPAAEVAETEITAAVGDHDVPSVDPADEKIEEIRFYISHGMPDQAQASLARLHSLTNDDAKLSEIRAEVDAAVQAAAAAQAEAEEAAKAQEAAQA